MRYYYYDGITGLISANRRFRKGLFFVVFRNGEWTGQSYTLQEMRAWKKEAEGARLKRFLADTSKKIKAVRQ